MGASSPRYGTGTERNQLCPATGRTIRAAQRRTRRVADGSCARTFHLPVSVITISKPSADATRGGRTASCFQARERTSAAQSGTGGHPSGQPTTVQVEEVEGSNPATPTRVATSEPCLLLSRQVSARREGSMVSQSYCAQ